MLSTVASSCGCGFAADNILGGVFSCPDALPPTAVVYRTDVRGVSSDGCDELVEMLRMVIETNRSTLPVLGNQLDLLTSCDVSIPAIDSEFVCAIEVDSAKGDSAAIVGGVAGGAVVLLIALVIFGVLLVIFSKKKRVGN